MLLLGLSLQCQYWADLCNANVGLIFAVLMLG